MPERKVVIVDDEADVRLPLRRFLLGKGYAVLEADSVASVRAILGRESVDAAVVDFSLPDGDGLDVLRSVKAQDASVPVVLLTGHGSIDLAVKAIKEGAEQFFTKPVELPALLVESGRLKLPIDKTFPLGEAAAALAHMRANKHFGKIVLVT